MSMSDSDSPCDARRVYIRTSAHLREVESDRAGERCFEVLRTNNVTNIEDVLWISATGIDKTGLFVTTVVNRVRLGRNGQFKID